jgi:hypothetical protein
MKIENVLTLYILSEINSGTESKFYYFLRNLPISKIPILHEHSVLDLFKEDEAYSRLNKDIEHYKKSYNELRRLVFSYGEQLKNQFIGAFLFGDYLWALYVFIFQYFFIRNNVKHFSIRSNNTHYLIPGTEYLQLTGLEGIPNTPLLNCCLKYSLKQREEFTDFNVEYNPEDFYDFHDKFQNITKITLNPNINNENLYFKFSLNFNNNNFDFYNIDTNELSKYLLLRNSSEPMKHIIIRMSCNEYDLKNIIYFLKTQSPEYYLENFSRLVKLISQNIFTIDKIFEQTYQTDNLNEVLENYKYLSNKKLFLKNLFNCLENKYAIDLTQSVSVEENSEVHVKYNNYEKIEL